MERTVRKVKDLIEEDPSMADAIATILQRIDEGEGEVEWADVRDDITSGHWGRLIEKGVLVEGVEGFQIDGQDEVRTFIEESDTTDIATRASKSVDIDDEETTWTIWDKGAAVATVAMFAGYTWGPARDLIGNTMDILIGPINAALPFFAVILVLSLFTGLYSTLLQANLMDMEKMGKYQEQMKGIQEKRKRAKEKGDEAAMERIQEEQMEAMADQMGMFKEQFRPMVWIMLLTIPVFLWMWWMLIDGNPDAMGTVVFPLAGEMETWRARVLGPIEAWIVWYFVCSMAFTQLMRKALHIQTTPTGT